MIRFPNPSSDISHLLLLFKRLYSDLSQYKSFHLDNISKAMVSAGMAASSGFIGKEALVQSTRVDRTRDPLYNQSKMYAEIFRDLGWISSSEDSALEYQFTELGKYAALDDKQKVFERSVISIVYPNRAISLVDPVSTRPFVSMLYSASFLDKYICRDEIILGPLSWSDRDGSLDRELNAIKNLRPSSSLLSKRFAETSARLKIQENTMRNYTRFPIGVLKNSNWFEALNTKGPYDRSTLMFKLTQSGEEELASWRDSLDLRLDDFDSMDNECKKAACQIGFYEMLNSSGFKVPGSDKIIGDSKVLLKKKGYQSEIHFSPYQQLSKKEADGFLGFTSQGTQEIGASSFVVEGQVQDKVVTSHVKETDFSGTISGCSNFSNEVNRLRSKGLSVQEIIDFIFDENRLAKKDVFYTLVGECFSSLGFNCHVSNFGVNYERYDAIILDAQRSIPIEIKSPTETEKLSIKAIRQALENKIIMLSRGFGAYQTQKEVTSLAVGYYLPDDRAEVSDLISAIKNAFGFNISVLDFKTLLNFSVNSVLGLKSISKTDFESANGYVQID
jgi:hypothetical protein